MPTGINTYEAGTERDHDNPHIEQVHDKHTMSNNSSCVYKGKAGCSKAALQVCGSAQRKQYVNGALIQVNRGLAFMVQ